MSRVGFPSGSELDSTARTRLGRERAPARQHQRRLASEARAYEARSKTYVDLLTTLRRLVGEIEDANPIAVAEDRMELDRVWCPSGLTVLELEATPVMRRASRCEPPVLPGASERSGGANLVKIANSS